MNFTNFVVNIIVDEAETSGCKGKLLDGLRTESDDNLAETVFASIGWYGMAFAKENNHAVVPVRFLDDARKIVVALKEKFATEIAQ